MDFTNLTRDEVQILVDALIRREESLIERNALGDATVGAKVMSVRVKLMEQVREQGGDVRYGRVSLEA